MTPNANIYPLLLDVAREGVRELDAHPIAGRLIRGSLPLELYADYLIQVVHQVRSSGPMLARAGERLGELGRPRLAGLFAMKAGEEDGHDRWALEDLAALGVSPATVFATPPCPAVRLYLEWTRYVVEAAPAAVLGLAFVLEWFGYCRAGRAADNLTAGLAMTGTAPPVRFLRGHGEADQHHIRTLARALADATEPGEAETVLFSARLTSLAYRGIFDWVGGRTPALASTQLVEFSVGYGDELTAR